MVDERRKQSQSDIDKILREGKKECFTCKKTKKLDQFYSVKQNRDGCDGRCIECRLSYENNRRKTLPRFAEAHNLRKYGLTLEQNDAMVKKQNNKCAICGIKMTRGGGKHSLHVDHCHKTNKVRALLCNKCNNGIGCLNDDIDLVSKALLYLKKHQSEPEGSD